MALVAWLSSRAKMALAVQALRVLMAPALSQPAPAASPGFRLCFRWLVEWPVLDALPPGQALPLSLLWAWAELAGLPTALAHAQHALDPAAWLASMARVHVAAQAGMVAACLAVDCCLRAAFVAHKRC